MLKNDCPNILSGTQRSFSPSTIEHAHRMLCGTLVNTQPNIKLIYFNFNNAVNIFKYTHKIQTIVTGLRFKGNGYI